MTKYTCSDCDREFSRKSDHTRHKNKKTPCELSNSKKELKKMENKVRDDLYLKYPINETIFDLKIDQTKEENKKYVLSKIKQAHQLLYEAENIEGESAMNDIMNLIFLRLIQDKLSDEKKDGKIDLLNKEYYNDEEYDLDDIFKCFDIKTLAIQELSTLRNNSGDGSDIIRLMGYILKTHEITGQIFLEENFMRTEKSVTLQSLIDTMFINRKTRWDINKMYEIEDLIGEIFESFISGYTKTNSKLSQFFTPRPLMNLILNYFKKDISREIKKYDKFYTADFCMGTAGWLVIFYNMFKQKYSNKILLSGGEVKPNTFQYGLMNLITTLNALPHYVQRDNSLTHIDDQKYHMIITNPPFKTDFKFDNVKTNFKIDKYTKKNKIKLDNVYKLKSNSPPVQFLELCIYKLHLNGICIIVLPYGELFFGSSKSSIKTREYLMKTIDITHIILCPSGVFTHTGIKTCIMTFRKDNTGTKEINFMRTNKECSNLVQIVNITREDISKEPNSSFYHRDYLHDKYIKELTEKIPQFEWVEFGRIFSLEKGKLQSSKVIEGKEYPVISISEKNKYTDNKDHKLLDGENIFICSISSGTSCGPYETKIKYFDGKCVFTNLLCRIVLNREYTDKIKLKFMYYYLNSIKSHIEEYYGKGSCNQSLDQKNFNRMKIPVPLIDIQEGLVKNMDLNKGEIEVLEKLIWFAEEKKKGYLEIAIKIEVKDAQIKNLGELCEIKNGESITKDKLIKGKYLVVGGGIKPIGYHNNYNIPKDTIIISRVGTCGYVSIYGTEIFVTDNTMYINKINDIIRKKYLYNYLKLLYKSFNYMKRGSTQPIIRKADLYKKIKITVPSLENQDKIIKVLDKYDNLIQMYKFQINEQQDVNVDNFLKILRNS